MLKLLSSRLPGEGKSSWNRISLVNTARPQECASLRGPGLNLITQPTNDPQMASEHDSGSGKGQRVRKRVSNLKKEGGLCLKGLALWSLAFRGSEVRDQSGGWEWENEGMVVVSVYADMILFAC